ncbi:MAG: GDP-mannose 4,6-dehydratase, partial [Alphaproteobacteria bacterium]|nr:GDP-mannose 4,6-dehydratase [Alphaproteobacteria bacterium]
IAFAEAGRTIRWEGKGVNEKGIDELTGRTLIEIDPRYYRPTEVDILLGNPAKAKEKLGWTHKISFKELVQEMVQADFVLMREEKEKASHASNN